MLERWQEDVVEQHTSPFLRGLFHSDGCRLSNWAQRRNAAGDVTRHEYPRYSFDNKSTDILDLCAAGLNRLAIAHPAPARHDLRGTPGGRRGPGRVRRAEVLTVCSSTAPFRAWHGPLVHARDRDSAGRARNSRPRDASGRPLPRGAAGVERVPEDLVLTADEAVDEAQRLLDDGLPFPAHEVLEGAWKAAPAAERELWRALAQLAVGLTHAQRGNARGAVALLDRAAELFGTWDGPVPSGIDIAGLRDHAAALHRQIDHDGVLSLAAADLRVRLRGPAPHPG